MTIEEMQELLHQESRDMKKAFVSIDSAMDTLNVGLAEFNAGLDRIDEMLNNLLGE